MQDTIQRQILSALLIALRPLARALLRAGIGFREFEEISKTAFVDIATKDYGLRGRPTNISRVAVMTGLTRKEVRRLRDKSTAGEETVVVKSTPMAAVLHRWYTEPEFLTDTGRPNILSFDGEGSTFSSLVRNFGGDIPPGAMRTELLRIEAIEELPDGQLKVLKRNVSSLGVHDRIINVLANQIYASTLAAAHNTLHDEPSERWVQRTVTTSFIRDSDLQRVRRISVDRLDEFTESIDDLFGAYETLYEKDEHDSPKRAIGIGVFYFEEDKSETDAFA
jgi:hypothetical protein